MINIFKRAGVDLTQFSSRPTWFATSLPIDDGGPKFDNKVTTFFHLPAELRNHVYELVASSIALTLLPPVKQRRTSSSTSKNSLTAPGLLLASRQCRAEALPIILSIASIQIEVVDFDFQNLLRVVPGFYSTELKALRSNNNLTLRLSFRQARGIQQQVTTDLRRWLVRRAEGLDRLPWRYLLDPEYAKINGSWSRDAVSRTQWLWILYNSSEETLQWELLSIIDVVEGPIKLSGWLRRTHQNPERESGSAQ